MLLSFLSIIPNAIKASFGPQVIAPNALNPFQLAVGTAGYWIQSQILNIPEQYGFFSSGPPRLQVYQASIFIFLCFMTGIDLTLVIFIITLMQARPDYPPVWRPVLAITVFVVAVWAMIWAMNCADKRQAPDYEWKDWKIRTE